LLRYRPSKQRPVDSEADEKWDGFVFTKIIKMLREKACYQHIPAARLGNCTKHCGAKGAMIEASGDVIVG
jgi:hypothetical protein